MGQGTMLKTVFTLERPFSPSWFKQWYLIFQGSVIQAAGYALFLIPHKIVPGGLYGISTVTYHLWGFPAGLSVIVMNIPLLAWGIYVLGPRFGFRTVMAIIMASVTTDIFIYFSGIGTITNDLFVSSLVGGAMVGFGVSHIFRAMATTGGVEIVGQVLYTRYKWPVGQTIMVINVCIIALGTLMFRNLKIALYSGIAIYTISKVMDMILEGISYYKGVMVISNHYTEILNRIEQSVRTGALLLDAHSFAGDQDKQIIITAVNRRELAFLKEIITTTDPEAYMMIFNSQEVYRGNQLTQE